MTVERRRPSKTVVGHRVLQRAKKSAGPCLLRESGPRKSVVAVADCGGAQKDKNNVIAATLNRLTNKADTSGRITNTLGDGP